MDNTASPTCLKNAWLVPGICLVVAALLELLCWGFTVDDAWIVSRVASHGLFQGHFSFNPGGPVTDAVTPLGFGHLVAGLGFAVGAETASDLFTVARWIGVACYFLSIFLAARWAVRRAERPRWLWLPALTALCVPLAAWAGAGLATAPVALMVLTGARIQEQFARRGAMGAALLGAAAAWRPELTPFCGWLVIQARPENRTDRLLAQVGAFLCAPLLVMSVRGWFFGHALPLSSIAKEPHLASGLRYVAVTLIWGGIPTLVWLLPGALRKQGRGWALVLHFVALALAGGDWMPALRLTAPLYPWVLMTVGGTLGSRAKSWIALIMVGFSPLLLLWEQGSDWRSVTARRERLVESGRRALAGAKQVACVDVGWVGLATTSDIVDLGGVTDPRIAALGGGHTSREIAPGLFSDRNVDTWVIRAVDRTYTPGMPLEQVLPSYWVDARLLQRATEMGFRGIATLPVQGTGGQYVIARYERRASD